MPNIQRTIRSMYRVGLREWWRQLQYIGDAKSGTFVGMDQYAFFHFYLIHYLVEYDLSQGSVTVIMRI